MATRRSGYALVRSLILAISTLAIVGVLFAVYQYSTGVHDSSELDLAGVGGENLDDFTHPDSPGVAVGDLGELGQGRVIRLSQYDPKSHQPDGELEMSSWRPVGDANGDLQRIEAVDLVIRMVTPNGQHVRIRADLGTLEVTKNKFDPQRGELTGHVSVDLDRRSDEERNALPEDERDAEPDESRMVRMTFESLTFDIESPKLETHGPFTMRMAEAVVEGNGLRVEYNEVDTRLEHFEIFDGGTMVLQGVGGLFDASGKPGDNVAGGAGDTDDTDATTVASQHLQPYHVKISGDVTIRGIEDRKVVQRLLADALDILYDFDLRKRNDVQNGSATLLGQSERVGEGAGSAEVQPVESRIEIGWSGPFVVTPDMTELANVSTSRKPRLHLTATGRRVLFAYELLEAVGRRLDVRSETRDARIDSDDGAPVVVTIPGQGTLTAPSVFIDSLNEIVQIAGPARLVGEASEDDPLQRGGGGAYDLRFSDSALLSIGTHSEARRDLASDMPNVTSTQYIRAATLKGDALLKRDGAVFAGDTLSFTFDPPSGTGRRFGDLRTVVADGRVLQSQGQDRLTADHLEVDLVAGPTGEAMPRSARARGHVVVTQGELMIAATDSVAVDMVPVVKTRAPFDLVRARTQAVLGGVDPATVDWDRRRASYESKVEYRPGLSRVEAHGEVRAYDPSRGLDLSADSVVGQFANGQITTARITGPDDSGDAFVQFEEMTISAHRINADIEAERADVYGPGKLTFVTLRGLDGKESDTPQDIELSWTKEMTYRGANDSARCVGDVRATSTRRLLVKNVSGVGDNSGVVDDVLKTASIEAEEMVFDFTDVAPKAGPSLEDRWWIFAGLVRRWMGPDESTSLQFRKEPVYFIASHNVVASFADVNISTGQVKNRVNLSTQKLTADLRAILLTVPTAGSLLIEDYESSGSTKRRLDESGAIFGQWDGDAPSQTYIAWGGSLTFHADRNRGDRNRADFRDDVVLINRRGRSIVFPDDMLRHRAFAPSEEKSSQTRLTCGALMVEFWGSGEADGAGRSGLGGMSARGLRQLDASNGVVLVSDNFTVEADRIVKYEKSKLLRIFGTEFADAEIYSDRVDGPRARGPEFIVNLETNAVDAPSLRLQSRVRP